MTKFCVWLAADAFLYIPIFALKEFGILTRVIETFRDAGEDIGDAEIVIATVPGDRQCIDRMLREANAGGAHDTIHIAVGDPLAGFEADPAAKEVRVLGGFIKRPPFWLITMDPPTPGPVRLACPNPNYETAFNLARAIECEKPVLWREMWDVVDELSNPDNDELNLRALTPDILGMVRLQRRGGNRTARIVESLAQRKEYADFLTTGLVTHKRYVTHKTKELAVFREAVRTACFLVNTAEVPTAKLVQTLSERPEFLEQLRVKDGEEPAPLCEEEAQLVTSQLIDNNLLAYDLSITPRQWHGAVKARNWGRRETAAASTFYLRSRVEYIARPFLLRWAKHTMNDFAEYIEDDRAQRIVMGGLFGTFLMMSAHVRVATATAAVPAGEAAFGSVAIAWVANIGLVASMLAIAWSLAKRPLQRSGIVNSFAPLVRGDPDLLELLLICGMTVPILAFYYFLVWIGANPMSMSDFMIGLATFLIPPFCAFAAKRVSSK